VAPILGVGGFFALGLWFWPTGHKILAVRLLFASGVCILTLADLQFEHWIKTEPKREASHPDRAWIAVDVSGYSGITWFPKGAQLSVQFNHRNTGKSPAKNVFFEAKALLPKMGESVVPVQAMKDYATDIQRRRSGNDLAGAVYFPGPIYPAGMIVMINRDELTALTKASGILC